MDREIKFREFVNGKFHYWGFVEEGIFKGPATPSLTRGKHSQLTGLHDKNGKDIYEGDVIRFKVDFPGIVFDNGLVRWSSKGYWTAQKETDLEQLLYDEITELQGEVIGNIYENPELLNNG